MLHACSVIWLMWYYFHRSHNGGSHYSEVLMIAMASHFPGVSVVYWTVCSCADQRRQQISASLTFVMGIHRWPVNSPHKGPVTQKMLPFDDVIMTIIFKTSLSFIISIRMYTNSIKYPYEHKSWWRHQMETFSALLAICAEASDAELWCLSWSTSEETVE